ncbi:M28 family peptidase [Roseibacillus persicicus]|uniref:Glutamine cyclotransferase n=1 Tax=Roseibacillus persicicus TaxID=454148 RepID=A0A918TIV5_9BACT|nr:M28 family peptidase [Roseibacillus persicicus]GHC48046.1 glutamine cyclotransferase [Roseibacillus persicicus]
MRLSLPLLLALCLVGCKEKETTSPPVSLDHSGTPFAHTSNILSFGPRYPGSQGAVEVRNYVTEVLEETGWTVGAQTFQSQTPIGPRTFTNLIARFPASPNEDPWKARIDGLLCAHLDSKYYSNQRFLGADDAGSACGLILTMAREMAETPEKASRMELIFFDGEEAFTENMGPKAGGLFDGIYGSRAYAARWNGASYKPSFGILLDMVGHKNLSIKVPADSPAHLVRVMNAAVDKLGHNKHFGMAAGEILDDHVPLNDAGIPTIDIIGDFQRSGWWHTPKDNLSIISPESLAITKSVVEEMLRELLK